MKKYYLLFVYFLVLFRLFGQVHTGDLGAGFYHVNSTPDLFLQDLGANSGPTSHDFDVTGDTILDLRLTSGHYSGVIPGSGNIFYNQYTQIELLNPDVDIAIDTIFVGGPFPPRTYVDTLPFGQNLEDPQILWSNEFQNPLTQTFFASYVNGSPEISAWYNSWWYYVGVRHRRAADTLYGWLDIDIVIANLPNAIFLREFAMESDVTVDTTFGVGLIEQNSVELSLFPNPTEDYVNLKSDGVIGSVSIYSPDGRFIRKEDGLSKVDVRELTSGVYFIEVIFESGMIVRRQFIKQ